MLRGSLYVETTSDRDVGARARANDAGPAAAKPSKTQTGDVILKNIVVLVPSEVIAAYVALISLLKADTLAGSTVRLADIVFLVLLIVCIMLRAHASLPADFKADIYSSAYWKQVNKPLVLVSCVAYVIWCFAVNETGPFGVKGQQLASIFAAAFGLLAPLLVPARPATA